jgi:hypothetical protein
MEAPLGKDRNTTIGVILVILGGLALLSNFGFFQGMSHLVGALFFAFLGGLALRHYQRKHRTGSLVGAFVLFGLAAAAAVSGALSGFFFLGLIGAGFGALYYTDRERWWAIIPAGTLLSLAVVAALDEFAPRYESGSVLFLGLAATFLLLTRLPDEPKRWAIYPAVVFVVLAVLGFSVGGNWLLPLALVGVGVYLLYRRNGEHAAVAESVAQSVVEPAVESAAPAGTGTAAAEPSAAGTASADGPATRTELQQAPAQGAAAATEPGSAGDGSAETATAGSGTAGMAPEDGATTGGSTDDPASGRANEPSDEDDPAKL